MASDAIVVFWGRAVRGHEMKAVQLFNEAVQYYAGLKEKGEIESTESVFLNNNGDDLAGFSIIRGDRDKLLRQKYSKERIRLNQRAEIILRNFKVVDATIGQGIQAALAEWPSNIKDLL